MTRCLILSLLLASTCFGQAVESPVSVVTRARTKLADSASATNRNLLDKAKERSSLKDFAVDATGTIDCRALLLAASDAGKTIDIPAGTYRISSDLTISAPVNFLGGAMLTLDANVDLAFTKSIEADPLQQIFSCDSSARVTLKQDHSLCWYGASRVAATDCGAALQQAVNGACNATSAGYAQQSGGVFIPAGYYRLATAIVYKGSASHHISIYGEPLSGISRGNNIGTQIDWYGTAATMLLMRGANGSTIQDIKFVTHATATCTRMIWWDALNADAGANPLDAASSGCVMRRVICNVGAEDCLTTMACIAIGHDYTLIPGSATSQVDHYRFESTYCQGQGTGKGIGIRFEESGNVRNFYFDRFYATHFDVGVLLAKGGSVFEFQDSAFANNTTVDVSQIGSGFVSMIGTVSENSARFLTQSGGSGPCNAILIDCDWQGLANTGGTKNIITVAGSVRIIGGTLRCVGASAADSIPWIDITGGPLTSAPYHTALAIGGVSFGMSYNDGTYAHLPVRQSANIIYSPTSYYADKRVSVYDLGGNTSIEFGGTTTKIHSQEHFGFRIPSLTTARRDAITPANGDIIYNETTGKFQGRAAGVWVDLH